MKLLLFLSFVTLILCVSGHIAIVSLKDFSGKIIDQPAEITPIAGRPYLSYPSTIATALGTSASAPGSSLTKDTATERARAALNIVLPFHVSDAFAPEKFTEDLTIDTDAKFIVFNSTSPTQTNLAPRNFVTQFITGSDLCTYGQPTPSIMDTLTATSPDSWIVSASPDMQFVDLGCAHTNLTSTYGKTTTNLCVSTVPYLGATLYSNLYNFTSPKFNDSTTDLGKLFADVTLYTPDTLITDFSSQFTLSIKDDVVTVKVGTGNEITYSYNDVKGILNTMGFMHNLASKLSDQALVSFTTDDAPDMFNFVFPTIPIKPENNAIYKAAEIVAQDTIQKFNTAYDNNLVAGMIYTQSYSTEMCAGPEEVRRYQIVLWLAIVLVAGAFAAFYSTATMPLVTDPGLLGGISVQWTKKRQ